MRILRVKLSSVLQKKLDAGRNKTNLAEEIGISVPKLQDILDDQWDYITRDSIERVADYFQLAVEDVFEFSPSPFWQSIKSAKECVFLRGWPSEEAFRIPMYDGKATQEVKEFLDSLGPIRDPTEEIEKNNEAALVELAAKKNCVVVGAPRSNSATEILLSRFFGAKPFDPSQSNREKLPFCFEWPPDMTGMDQSSLRVSDAVSKTLGGKFGIVWVNGGQLLVDFKERDEYTKWETEKGTDAGLIFVADRRVSETETVKLIVLAGIRGVGTFAAAKALIRDARDLQPLPGEDHVFGIVEGRYSKRPHTTDGRTYQGFRWVYRHNGRSPIKFKKVDGPKAGA